MKTLIFVWLAFAMSASSQTFSETNRTGSRVTFNQDGITLVDGAPFFPIGLFTYELNSDVLAEIHELQCNTVLHGFATNQLDLLHEHGLMAVCPTDAAWLKAAEHHPALLAWYLTDEPENHGVTPESERNRFLELKARDPHHPIGQCHTSFEALTAFKDSCDFTMTDIYPITAKRDKNIMGVSIMMDEARRIHGATWPQWTYIQTFGGPEADQGVWAVPLPHEVRFMVYQALVHRATGILYFSYWPRASRTWQSLAPLNNEIQQIVPRLVSAGRELPAKVESEKVQVRVRVMGNVSKKISTNSGLVIAVNTSPKFVQTEIQFTDSPVELRLPFENRTVRLAEGKWQERFAPYAAHVYVWGVEPQVKLARESGSK